MIIGYGRTSTIEQVAGLEAQISGFESGGSREIVPRERKLGRAS